MQDPGQRRGEGRQRGRVMGFLPSCHPMPSPPGMLGRRTPGLLPTKSFCSPTCISMELAPCAACVLSPTASARPPTASQPSSRAKDRVLGLLEVKLRGAGQGAADCHL